MLERRQTRTISLWRFCGVCASRSLSYRRSNLKRIDMIYEGREGEWCVRRVSSPLYYEYDVAAVVGLKYNA